MGEGAKHMQIRAHERLHSPQKGFQRPQTNIKRKTYPPPTREPAQPQGLDLLPMLGTRGRARECLPAGAEHPARFCVLLSSNEKYAVGSFRNRTAEAPGFTFPTYTGAARPSTLPRAPGCGSSRGRAVTAPSQSHRKGKTLRTNSRHVLPPVQDTPGVGHPQGTPRSSEGLHRLECFPCVLLRFSRCVLRDHSPSPYFHWVLAFLVTVEATHTQETTHTHCLLSML